MAADMTSGAKAGQSFARLFRASPAPFLILEPDAPRFTIAEVNDAYLAATMRTREDVIGRGVFEAYPDNPDDPIVEGVRTLRASLEHVLASKKPDTLPGLKYDIARPDGTFEARWWSPVNSPVLDDNGEVEAIIHNANDVTEQYRAEAALRESESHLANELRHTTVLRDLAARLVTEESGSAIHGEILSAAMAITKSDGGTVQVYDPKTRSLVLLVTQGMPREMTDSFHRVDAASTTACGIALMTGQRAFVDFDQNETDEACRMHVEAGYRSAQATPLLSRDRSPVGMINTHWRASG
ncbi:PAS domain-containing protein, partial [Phenylobacterium sp.]|uniref:PAS domain-containing protein n=1 Tax=Phenylobacterium sp. TaxID=1871053 RepID=UPI0025D89EE3